MGGTVEPDRPGADGLILLDKPSGITSHDCVASVRKGCPRKTKVGHSGTLDPFCTGLLILMVGRGTRLAPLLQGMDKTYEGILRFGEGTDTCDRDGQVVATGPVPELGAEGWQGIANRFVGPLDQIPPDFSAKRVGGQRAYDLARQGVAVGLSAKRVEVYLFEVAPVSGRDLRFRLGCSSGTYIRAIARDMGTEVGCPAHCLELRRTIVGPYRIGDANSLDAPFHPEGFIPFDAVELGIPVHRANPREERLLLNGQPIPAPASIPGAGALVKVMGPSGRFLALARSDGRQLQPTTVFHPDPASPPDPAAGG
jgi:tRNA pseudouridine55 synthase